MFNKRGISVIRSLSTTGKHFIQIKIKKFMIGFCSPMGFMAWQVGNNRCMLGWTGLNQRLYPLLDLEWPSAGLVLKTVSVSKQQYVGVLAVAASARYVRSCLILYICAFSFFWGGGWLKLKRENLTIEFSVVIFLSCCRLNWCKFWAVEFGCVVVFDPETLIQGKKGEKKKHIRKGKKIVFK